MPALSIVTVAFDDLAALAKTRASIEARAGVDHEHIVVDGGSTDGTVAYLEASDGRIRWVSERDRGPYDAMNKGARMAEGEWVLFLNAGDTLARPGSLRDLLARAQVGGADIIFGDHWFNGKLRECETLEALHGRLQRGDLRGWLRGHPCHQSVIARSALLREHPFDLGYRIAADFHWMERMRQLGARSARVPGATCVYEPGGLSSRNFLRCLVEWRRVALLAGCDKRTAGGYLTRLLARRRRKLAVARWRANLGGLLGRRCAS